MYGFVTIVPDIVTDNGDGVDVGVADPNVNYASPDVIRLCCADSEYSGIVDLSVEQAEQLIVNLTAAIAIVRDERDVREYMEEH